jgi:hypothetical protein
MQTELKIFFKLCSPTHIIILPLLATLTIKLVPEDIFEKCRLESEGLWKGGKPKKWYYAIPIFLFG